MCKTLKCFVSNCGLPTTGLRSGELTRTDVAQAQARVQEAISLLLQAESDLTSSQAVYRQVVGRNPSRLSFPKMNLPIPKSRPDALSIALSAHPAIQSAQHTAEAAEYAVKQIQGELLPTVSIEASASRRWEPSPHHSGH